MLSSAEPALVRAIGRWSLTAGIINGIIGSGIFGMPSAVANLVGVWSPLAVLLAGCGVFFVVLCFAEVGSRFDDAGGPYLYTREAFGPAAGFQIGWLQIWTRLFSGAAALNILVAYTGALIPPVQTPLGRAITMTGGIILVTAVNIAGVRNAAWTVNVFTIGKLLPLLMLVVLGSFHLSKGVLAGQVVSNPNWTEAVLLLVFAYGGFESAVIAASETQNPKRDTAFALVTAIVAVTVVYLLVQLAVVGVLPHAAQSSTPIAAALAELLGPVGSTIAGLGVVVSIYGWLTGFALMTPRILYSMARRSEMPAFLGSVHPRFRTPWAAIAVNSAAVLVMGLASNFAQAATLAAIARLAIFVVTCGTVIVFRKRDREPEGFHIPCGTAIAVLGIAFSAWLLSTRSFAQGWILIAIVVCGTVFWSRVTRDKR